MSKKSKKYLAPIIITVLFILFFLGIIATVFYFVINDDVPVFPMAFYSLFYFVPIIGIIIALFQRLREIKGGEEDEASKY